MPLDVLALNVDLLAAPGHKGLLGPLGTGILYVRPGVEERVASLRQGGTGSQSESDRQPDDVPDKYESGNLNVPGIIGLGAGVAWLAQSGVDAVRSHAQRLVERLIEGLAAIDGVTVYGPRDPSRRVGLVSIRLEGYDPQELAATLDAAFGVQVRAGLHCAPWRTKRLERYPSAARFVSAWDRSARTRISKRPSTPFEKSPPRA